MLDWLSDGEKSFLGRMCLLTLLETDEALILLDEPEVHFNDFWKRQIVNLIDINLKNRQSHILISTHSSITLTDVPKENIMVLDRNGNYTNKSLKPSMNTFAADPSDIMVHVFGSPYPSGELSINRLENELENKFNRSPQERKETLENLKDVVASGYWRFVIRQELQTLK
nr:AAA family ATPase [Rippkaea orientalis]